jgi:hypothetical protein
LRKQRSLYTHTGNNFNSLCNEEELRKPNKLTIWKQEEQKAYTG